MSDLKQVELQDFVQTTLARIIEGAAKAQNDADEYDAHINPPVSLTTKELATQGIPVTKMANGEIRPVTMIEFDVAVSAEASEAQQAGFMVTVAALVGGMKDTTESSDSQTQRIKFSVPVLLPSKEFKHPRRRSMKAKRMENR